MSVKVAINGFGRIGRSIARIISQREDIELVAVNDGTQIDTIIYLAKHDSVHGRFDDVEKVSEDTFRMGKDTIKVLNDYNPETLDFGATGAQIVLECTGKFLTKEKAQAHIKGSVEKVIMSAPAKDDTPTYVMGVNHEDYEGEAIISNASCTTNCLAPIAKVLEDLLGIEKGLMTTVHSYTNDQRILDVKHAKDKRRGRAAAVNMIPTTTGAAKAISKVIPSLQGKMHGQSVRVPTPNVSLVDLNILVSRETTKEEVNTALKVKAQSELKNILAMDDDYGVSGDFAGDPHSSIVAEDLTQVIDGNMVKVMSWYDNEWGYSNRMVDMALFISGE